MRWMLVCLVLASTPVAGGSKTSKDTGGKDDVKLTDLDGRPVKFSKYRAAVTVIDFWATWCVPCIVQFPLVEQLYEKYKNDRDVAVVAVNIDESNGPEGLAKIRKVVKDNKLAMPVLLDPEQRLIGRFEGGGKPTPHKAPSEVHLALPTLMVIDRGSKTWRESGTALVPVEKFVDDKSAIIELARRGQLPEGASAKPTVMRMNPSELTPEKLPELRAKLKASNPNLTDQQLDEMMVKMKQSVRMNPSELRAKLKASNPNLTDQQLDEMIVKLMQSVGAGEASGKEHQP